MDTRLQRGFRVGEYEVRPLEGRIVGPTGSQHVQPKIMEVLLCLAEQPGEIVERDALMKRGWGDTVVTPDVLTRCISELRHLLDDHHEAVKYIQTIPKRGYRLVADVSVDDHVDEASKTGRTEPSADASATDHGDTTRIHQLPAISFWEDLKRRNVVRVGIAYVVVSWLLLQVGEIVFDALQLPPWALTMLLALLALGFPVAIIISWVFQVTPEGVVWDIKGSSQGKTSLRRNLDVVIIGGLIIAVGLLSYQAFFPLKQVVDRPGVSDIPAPAPSSSIAVLKFLNIGGEPHFADGLGEELLDRLAQLKELGVAARTSSWAFAEKAVDVPTIAAQLSVNYVLEGSVRHSGDRIRITAQLNDGKSGKHIWSQTYDRTLTTENFFNIQTEIANQVVRLLRISLSPESELRLANRPETSMQALEFYLRGQELFRQPHSDTTLDAAAAMFERALEVDPRFAMAYAGLCDTALGRYMITRDTAIFEDAERACHRGLTLDQDNARVLAALGGLYLFSGQPEKAEEVLRRAMVINPNLIDAYADLGEALENQGRLKEAEAMFRGMVARQPGYWYAHNALGNFLYRQSRNEEAVTVWTRVTELAPDRAIGFNNVGTAYYMLGDFESAARAYEMSVTIEPYVDNYTNLGLAYYYDGHYEEAAEMQQKALALRPEDPRIVGRLATAYQAAGREEDARKLFSDAIALIERRLAINPDDIRLNRFLAVFNASIGRPEEARRAIRHALKLRPDMAGVQFDAAKVVLASGDEDVALDYLERARALGYSTDIIRSDPFFSSLHGRQRFIIIAQAQDRGELP